jgi:hypothetical protein
VKKILVFLFLILFIIGFASAQIKTGSTLYVSVKAVTLKSGTGAFAESKGTLNYGDKVTVIKIDGKSVEVQSVEDPLLTGWTTTANFSTKQIVVGGLNSTATAKEVALGGKGFNQTETEQSINQAVEVAITKASKVFIEELPKNSIIAVINISSDDLNLTTFIIDELENQLVMSKQFRIVDRKILDTIRAEQKLQLSGNISDQSAVSIGNMSGANIVITGYINGVGNTQRLTLKALDVKTAKTITTAQESF